MTRLLAPRNNLAHANAISLRQAEQVICYANDTIDSLKSHYAASGMQNEYNVPLVLRVIDSFGNARSRSELGKWGAGVQLDLMSNQACHLRPGDVLTVEVEIDPSFDPATYSVTWRLTGMSAKAVVTGTKLVLAITNRHVMEQLDVTCAVRTTKEWHRMGHSDDMLHIFYKVLPPIVA